MLNGLVLFHMLEAQSTCLDTFIHNSGFKLYRKWSQPVFVKQLCKSTESAFEQTASNEREKNSYLENRNIEKQALTFWRELR